MEHPTPDKRTVLRLAAEADVDPRSVRSEFAAMRGERPHVTGRAGEKLRVVLARRGYVSSEAA
ncbi:MAG TPA: hypothetical protein VFR23_26130 [Jiangellaceae bacterium]|nr:hypothetical protein [Jiangellaceae bacterium]